MWRSAKVRSPVRAAAVGRAEMIVIEELQNSARSYRAVSWFLPDLLHSLRVSAPPVGGGTCSFGEHENDRATFQMCLGAAVRGPESFLGRNCSYGARPVLLDGTLPPHVDGYGFVTVFTR
ncbi:hypothetical protein GCM10011374_04450 [Kocuria dechangensis]|uniref:Uncharacterized protein n=1 Tax=Kocuria dechangensis TaxID=1176249 RepID=A0A917LN76_9MICC|nr:hypothetical protein GCM10011374_04450 [Kocuria dechangensis]